MEGCIVLSCAPHTRPVELFIGAIMRRLHENGASCFVPSSNLGKELTRMKGCWADSPVIPIWKKSTNTYLLLFQRVQFSNETWEGRIFDDFITFVFLWCIHGTCFFSVYVDCFLEQFELWREQESVRHPPPTHPLVSQSCAHSATGFDLRLSRIVV